jgi:hypothetical protein
MLTEEEVPMKKRKLLLILSVALMIIMLTGCTLPGFSTPTPFTFPTPDKTMTALFEPTQAVPATSAGDDTPSGSEGTDTAATDEAAATETQAVEPTDEIQDTNTPPPPAPTATETAISYVGPAIRGGPSITAAKKSFGITIDGNLSEWTEPTESVIKYVVFGATNWTDAMDASGSIAAVWDENYLYIGVVVKDDMYVQEGTKEKIYLGDSLEINFDRYVSGDYYLQAMTADDYQIGISPGRYGIETCAFVTGKLAAACAPEPPEAYMWYPFIYAGSKTEIKIGAKETGSGYQVEFKIPWSVIGVTNPNSGDHYGFAISINDNDVADTLKQQSVVSNVSTRFFSDPTSWGDLTLE